MGHASKKACLSNDISVTVAFAHFMERPKGVPL